MRNKANTEIEDLMYLYKQAENDEVRQDAVERMSRCIRKERLRGGLEALDEVYDHGVNTVVATRLRLTDELTQLDTESSTDKGDNNA